MARAERGWARCTLSPRNLCACPARSAVGPLSGVTVSPRGRLGYGSECLLLFWYFQAAGTFCSFSPVSRTSLGCPWGLPGALLIVLESQDLLGPRTATLSMLFAIHSLLFIQQTFLEGALSSGVKDTVGNKAKPLMELRV